MLKIIISPAKKMVEDLDSLPPQALPQLLPQAEELLAYLKSLPYEEAKNLWKCSDQLARVNYQRLQRADLRGSLTPALLAYEGIQYQYMAPRVFEDGQWAYVQKHLRILSGFYGVLRPFDGVTAYRLEMQAKVKAAGARDLYEYWGDRIYRSLAEETDCVVNLASKEYSKVILDWQQPPMRVITCLFGERREGRLIQKGTQAKMARGEMARYMAEGQIENPEQLTSFNRLGYRYAPELSERDTFVFIKERGSV